VLPLLSPFILVFFTAAPIESVANIRVDMARAWESINTDAAKRLKRGPEESSKRPTPREEKIAPLE